MRRLPIYRAFRYQPTPNDNLTKCVSELGRIAEGVNRDLVMDGSGELGGRIQAWGRQSANEICRKYGFRDTDHVHDVANKRMDSKFVFFKLGHHLHW